MNSLAGVLPVLHMPYRDDDKIDFDALGREIDFAYECGADGIVLAMVTELLRLTHEERREVAAFFGQNSKGRGSITISVGAESTLEAVELARNSDSREDWIRATRLTDAALSRARNGGNNA